MMVYMTIQFNCIGNFMMVITNGEKSFWGFVTVGGRKHTFEISKPENSQGRELLFKVDWRLKRLLGTSLNSFLKENHFRDPLDFYCQFNAFVKNSLNANKCTEMWLRDPLKNLALLKSLQQEIKNTRDYVRSFDIESGLLNIEISDAQSRIHKAVLKISQNYKIEPITVVSHDLPLQRNTTLECTPNLNSIFSVSEFCEKFLELVTHFQQFWNMITFIDSQCCILDPLSPTFKDVYRRIKLCNTMSIALTFNPFCCRQVPHIKLLGCQSEVNYHQNILQKNLENELWDMDEDLIFNLSNVLELSIPIKTHIKEPEVMDLAGSGECAICFTLTLNNKALSEMCENSNCKSVYHSQCLFTYLHSIPRNRNYFGKIQGECPNCEEIIFCTVPKLI